MLRRLTLAVVCVVGMCSCVRADVMSRLIVPRDYGVKLCGREFIRAVIYTCGGSRWKRAAGGDSESFQWSSLSDDTAGDDLHSWLSVAGLAQNHSPPEMVSSPSLADLLALYAGEQQQQQPLERSLPAALLDEQDGSPGQDDWSMVSKKKRNFSAGVAGMCCSQGCTKNDIGRLC